MSQSRSASNFVQLYNIAAAFIIASEVIAHLLKTDGGMASVGMAMFLVLISFPSCLVLLLLFGMPIAVFPGHDTANGFITLGMFYAVGWIQWGVLVPYLSRKLDKSKGGSGDAA